MKRLIAATVFLVTSSVPLLAADAIEITADPSEVVAQSHDWSGLYLGATLGYGWGNSEQFTDLGNTTGEYDIDGLVAGGTLGYNHQFGNIVAGVETDFSYSGINGAGSSTPTWDCYVDEGCETDVEWFGTVRARLGYSTDNVLPYITGGFAYGKVRADVDDTPGETAEETLTGWTAGVGAEYAFSSQMSVKLEYLHVDLGDIEIADFGGFGVGKADVKFNTARVGVNYSF